jgi:hypothetical protein
VEQRLVRCLSLPLAQTLVEPVVQDKDLECVFAAVSKQLAADLRQRECEPAVDATNLALGLYPIVGAVSGMVFTETYLVTK